MNNEAQSRKWLGKCQRETIEAEARGEGCSWTGRMGRDGVITGFRMVWEDRPGRVFAKKEEGVEGEPMAEMEVK